MKTADRLVRAIYDAEQVEGDTSGSGLTESLGLSVQDAKQVIRYAEQQQWIRALGRVMGQQLPTDLELTPHGTRYVDSLFGDRPEHQQQGGVILYSVNGNNARIVINSHDASTNIVNVGSSDELFDRLERAIADGVADAADRERALTSARELRAAPDTTRLAGLLQAGANVTTIISPFLPALALIVAQGQ